MIIKFFVAGKPETEPKKDPAYKFTKGGGRTLGIKKRDPRGRKAAWAQEVFWASKLYFQSHKVEPFAQYVPLTVDITVWIPKPKNSPHIYPVTSATGDDDNYHYLITNGIKKVCMYDDSQIIGRRQLKLFADEKFPMGAFISIQKFKIEDFNHIPIVR